METIINACTPNKCFGGVTDDLVNYFNENQAALQSSSKRFLQFDFLNLDFLNEINSVASLFVKALTLPTIFSLNVCSFSLELGTLIATNSCTGNWRSITGCSLQKINKSISLFNIKKKKNVLLQFTVHFEGKQNYIELNINTVSW